MKLGLLRLGLYSCYHLSCLRLFFLFFWYNEIFYGDSMPGMIDCFLFCMFVLVEMVACRWIHVAFLWHGVCSYMYFDISMHSMMIIIIIYFIFFMDICFLLVLDEV